MRSWSAYELAKQMKRSLSHHWPRAESGVYDEPKNLVARGLATAVAEATGRRPRTVYAISPKGRRALQRWLTQPSVAPQFESEALVRALFADRGTKDDLLATLRQMQVHAQGQRDQLLSQGADYLSTGGPFPERLHIIALIGRFLLSLTALYEEWARWAETSVESWPDVGRIRDRELAMETFRRVVGEDLVQEFLAWEARRRPAAVGA
jgi:DNA-binding PadR family transcriptional regulator